MIGDNHVDGSVTQCLPKLFAVLAFPNRRAAFEFSGAVGNVFGGKMKIMRASLSGDSRS